MCKIGANPFKIQLKANSSILYNMVVITNALNIYVANLK